MIYYQLKKTETVYESSCNYYWLQLWRSILGFLSGHQNTNERPAEEVIARLAKNELTQQMKI